jgi:thiol-disulfide isomerase/thioredoxin
MPESSFAKSSKSEQPRDPARAVPWTVWPWAALLAVLLVAVAGREIVRRAAEGGRGGQHHPGVGTKVTELALEPLTGDPPPITTADLAGHVTLINFWGPWCGFCIEEFPHLMEIEQHFRDQEDFRFLSVSSNPDPRDQEGLAEFTTQFLKEQRAEFPTYHDVDARTQFALIKTARVVDYGYPTTVVLDRDARIRGIWVGYRSGDERQVRLAIEQALRGEPLPPPPTHPKS